MNYKSSIINSKQELINSYDEKEFNSPFRSTIPLLELFFENKETLKEILLYDESFNAIFEDETKPYEESKHPSCTDLRLYNNNINYCIEAKYTENEYDCLENALLERPGRKKAVMGFINIINTRCNTNIHIDELLSITYQMIHRFASACKVLGKTEMLYFCCNITSEKEPTHEFQVIQDKWTINKERNLSREIKKAMTNKVMNITLKEIIEIN